MGSMLQARCSCGYVSGNIFAGGGFEGGRNLPAVCRYRSDVVTIDMEKKGLKCTRCGRKPSAIYDVFSNDDALDETRDNQTYNCPKCGTRNLVFDFVGIWD